MLLDELKAGLRIEGLIPAESVTVIATRAHGADAVELTFKRTDGSLSQRVVFRKDEATLSIVRTGSRTFDSDASDFKRVAEAQRITLAGQFDPMLAVATSDVQPLPHQISAVYSELIPRTPLRFLLADDPGAGKTIMAGLYIKELRLRNDIEKCLIVAPGGLVDQWQDELYIKFGLDFDLLTRQMVESDVNFDFFDKYPLLIARMDQLSRNEELQARLKETEWDLIVVDEAHRMGAHYFGGKLEKTKRFQLGEILGDITRHYLLMTATPHSGKEEDFQLFLTLLDKDRFEGKQKKSVDTTGVMRRMVKEDLLTFEGKRLFPERIAETVPYELTVREYDLYELVTNYVREGMNRAERLDGKRRNTVGFALTVLQRRLASSPEAIYKSLMRRKERLERRKQDILSGNLVEPDARYVDVEEFDDDEYSFDEIEALEEELLDAATAAMTIEELTKELNELTELVDVAKQVRGLGTDRKWTELSNILQDHVLTADKQGRLRKLIIFTEHRDTLDYLTCKIRTLIGRAEVVKSIHGGVSRVERRQITEEFAKNTDVQILVATDAAGEGLNLHAAHLMVNYDLPWNPNRIEQRFGRIHRIGQEEVCRLWNLVAVNTREGAVFTRLLDKIEQMRQAFGGKVFDVLGEAFAETPLRDLLNEAIRYGERPDVKARMHEIVDSTAGDGVGELLKERALASDHFGEIEFDELRAAMDEAHARRLQPHYIEMAFKAAFTRLGGRIAKREAGRYEIANVPASIRAASRQAIATKYERVAFDLANIEPDNLSRADLLAPGHPLHDAVMNETIARFGGALLSGTVLVSADVDEPCLLVGVSEEIVDATGDSIAKRFGYAFVDETGNVTPAGPAPYLDCVAAPDVSATHAARELSWLGEAEDRAMSWIIANQLPGYLAEIQSLRAADIARTRELVVRRLEGERDRLFLDATVAMEEERAGRKPKETSESLSRKAVEIDARLGRRLTLLSKQAMMSTTPPQIATAALVLPLDMVENHVQAEVPMHAKETKAVERRGVDLVLERERALGRFPVEQAFNNPGFDVLSTAANGDTYRIEVKARIAGAKDFFVTHNEVMTGKNAVPRYRLALVRVDPAGPQHDEVRYLDAPFSTTELGDFDATGIRANWHKTWAKGRLPF